MQYTGDFAYAFYKKTLALFRCVFSIAWLVCHANAVHAQDPPRQEIDINAFIAGLFPDPSDDSDYSELFESLLQYYTNPLDINAVTADELSATLILSETQIQSFIKYRSSLGPFLSLYELQAVPGFDLPTIRRLLPFVSLHAKPTSLREAFKNPDQHFLMLRAGRLIENQQGFIRTNTSEPKYAGNPLNAYLRYRNTRSGQYSIGLTSGKDAGERLWYWNAKRQIFGPDFTSFHAQVLNRGRLKNLIAGDYQMQAGQGVVFGAGFSLGKGSEVIKTAYRSTLGLKPYTSSAEVNFFRGTALTFKLASRTDISVMFSRVERDATLDQQSSGETFVTSLPESGYHRTASEHEKHNNLQEQNAGLHLLHKLPSENGQVGFTALYTGYAASIRKRELAYNQFEFSGKRNLIAGLHGDYRWKNYHFFGEGAVSQSKGTGVIAGSIASFGKKWDATFLGRHYSRNFHSFYSNAISEATRPINENALYAGLRFMPAGKWQLSGYFDYFWFPWLRYQVDQPSKGFDYYLHLLFKPNKKMNVYALFHEKQKEQNAGKGKPNALATTVRRSAMINFEYENPLHFSVRTRCQVGDSGEKKVTKSKGITILQDLSLHFSKIELSARFAWFNTDDYDSRQYVYEKDMLYAFSIPAYYNAGTRHYLMLRYTVLKQMKVWLRWSQTNYTDLETISSGLNEIKGSKRSEVKMQVMYQL